MANRFVSFFEKVGSELKKLFTSTSTEQQIQSTITYAAPVVETILTFVDPAIEPLVAGAINIVKSDLATISTVAQTSKVTPGSTALQSVQAAANSVNSNLQGLLQLAEIKNSAKVQQITAAVNLVTQEMDALIANLTGNVQAPATA